MKRTSLLLVLFVLLLGVLAGCDGKTVSSDINDDEQNVVITPPQNQESQGRKLIPDPHGGIYLGQTERQKHELVKLEQAIGQKVPIVFTVHSVPLVVGQESVEEKLSFNAGLADKLWNEGYFLQIGAYETYPGFEPFTVDKLLQGDYDEKLHAYAEQLKAYGQPMFFTTAREPNGVGANTMGGFGKDGDESWDAKGGLVNQFDPFRYDHPDVDEQELYKGLGDDTVCDGIERLGAAQRYYHDFFTRREGIDFLTFGTMGWTTHRASKAESEGGCNSFEDFYYSIGEEYSDWVSLNMYAGLGIPKPDGTYDAPNPEDLTPEALLNDFEFTFAQVRKVAPHKPVLFEEAGFCGEDRGTALKKVVPAIIRDYPEVKALVFWGHSPPEPTCLLDGVGGAALKEIIDADPRKFPSCPTFSDGSTVPGCTQASKRDLNSCESDCKAFGGPEVSMCIQLCTGVSDTCYEDCISNGESHEECNEACGGQGTVLDSAPDEISGYADDCYVDCVAEGETPESCDEWCDG